eukprot:TRINITY_DN5546_c0_g1_i1.p1 TRINITY_DN5546_c0_g1~~TRINITY_DN5546_c0_g1_i1.p1  ORF type:complete len:461 (+),score=129.35 TRINITY_DN5546_c0_g1_i1:171-1553(+)
MGTVPLGNQLAWQGRCFNTTTATVAVDSNEWGSITATITLTASEPASAACSDLYVFSTLENTAWGEVLLHGVHTFAVHNLTENDMDDLQLAGLRVFLFYDGAADLVLDLAATLAIFLNWNGNYDKVAAEADIKFLKDYIGMDLERRDTSIKTVTSDDLQTGDIIHTLCLNGLDELQLWVSGGASGHTCIAMRADNGTLYVCENLEEPTWPTAGVQCNPFDDWVQLMQEKGNAMAVFTPLAPELRARLNIDEMWDTFEQWRGVPFGYANFAATVIDRETGNLPYPLTMNTVVLLAQLINDIDPASLDLFLGQGLNLRLGTSNLTFFDCVAEGERRGHTMGSLWAIPDDDAWLYKIEGRTVRSRVCSAWVAEMLRAGGAFGNVTITAAELAPRDVYELAIYDAAYAPPAACQKADPQLPYCQIMGEWRVPYSALYNSVVLHDHYAETCGTQPASAAKWPEGC